MEAAFTFRDSLEKHWVGMSTPLLQFGNSIQTNLWKFASTFHPFEVWTRKLNFKSDQLHLFKMLIKVTCLWLVCCYLFCYQKDLWTYTLIIIIPLVHKVLLIPVSLKVTYTTSMSLNATFESLYILRATPEVWIPVRLPRP